MKTLRISPMGYIRVFLLSSVALLAGCAGLTVTKVTPDNDATVKGIRYYLPKPFLQVTPQADGTVAVNVIYLPDKSHEYAIDPSSTLSSYTFQISHDEKGLLTAVEYKASTSIVGQQLATSAGAAAAQVYNANSAALAAQQTQVNTAQANVDTASANAAAAQATLNSDKANSVTNTIITTDESNLAQAQAKLQVAKSVLQRVQGSVQAVSTSVTPAAGATTTGPTMGTIFGQPTWSTPVVYNLPDKFGPVLFAINDWKDKSTGENKVEIKAVTSVIPGSMNISTNEYQKGVNPKAQLAFESVGFITPTLLPLNQTNQMAEKVVIFKFSQPINKANSIVLTTIPTGAYAPAAITLSQDNTLLKVDMASLTTNSYALYVDFNYVPTSNVNVTNEAKQTVSFTIKN
jgi:hypothetical protein